MPLTWQTSDIGSAASILPIPAVPAAEKAAVEANVKVTANYLLSIQGAVWFMTYTSGAGGSLTIDFGGDCVSTPKPHVQPNMR